MGWARTRQNLGGALSRIAEWRGNQEGAKYADEAIQALQDALHVFTSESHPASWTGTQMQLASALQRRAELPGVENPKELLSRAVQIHRTALEAVPRAGNPSLWADGQYRLGIALVQTSNLAHGSEQISLLADASSAFQNALHIITRDDQPWAWASLQANLGHIRESLGDRDPEKEYRTTATRFPLSNMPCSSWTPIQWPSRRNKPGQHSNAYTRNLQPLSTESPNLPSLSTNRARPEALNRAGTPTITTWVRHGVSHGPAPRAFDEAPSSCRVRCCSVQPAGRARTRRAAPYPASTSSAYPCRAPRPCGCRPDAP